MNNDQNLVWIDMEMTGLDPETCKVLEIATIVTDPQLNILAEGPVIAVHQPDDILDNMDPWCVDTHGKTGLTARCRASEIDEQMASQMTIKFLENYVPAGKSPLCGNTIGQDRRFMVKYMPELEAYFHYRSIDVSTIKELAVRWQPEVLSGFKKKGVHLALDDIRESIAELQYYREKVFSI
ncbi:oligoribonuclease [Alteromonas oceanisediminis]|uniref:oligoribonuclease n=1 Tax=Alteromonas oceanisediminis TaxID=2836180 RepID=UPI001BDB3683|nr:oligoribonuclease [Alteromonas oceanisediminis]MBT0586055.1 oligoribonuclease [Alteromonas oceanisediminis]